MVAFTGKDKGKDYNSAPVISGSKKIWFLNGDLVRIYHSSRATGTITLYNINKDQNEICFTSKRFFLNNSNVLSVMKILDFF